MEQVLDLINARDAWSRTKGAGVTIAVVDTGINGRRAEFTADRRHGGFASNDADAWDDDHGHGTMCAAIAAGSRDRGGEINGVAPMASLMSCRTTFGEVELSSIYDLLRERRLRGECIVATNSFGKRTGKPPVAETPNLFTDALQEATTAGVHTIFSAGNYHELAGGTPSGCEPTSIWLHKCLGSVCTVATCDQDRQMWHYSSRGPGQLHGVPGMGSKPDVTAPTPRNGEILFGSELRVMPHGWGTSGAAPQVAGLAALLLSLDKSLSSDMVFGYIRDTARSLGYAPACQGHGMIDCTAAIRRIH